LSELKKEERVYFSSVIGKHVNLDCKQAGKLLFGKSNVLEFGVWCDGKMRRQFDKLQNILIKTVSN
jgi:hypothetical protein